MKSNVTPIEGTGLLANTARERRESIRNIFRDNFADALEDSGMTQKELADRLGIKEYTMSRYALGKSTPRASIVGDIAKLLDISPDKLVPGLVSTSVEQRLRINIQALDTGNMWIEFSGAFDRETANEMIGVMSKNKLDFKPPE